MEKPEQSKLPSPEERLELLLLGLARRVPVEELCRQAGVSRELFYRWLGRVRKAGLKALEAGVPGPKAFPPEKAAAEACRLRERVERLEKANRELAKERDTLKLVAETGRRIIQRNAWGPVKEPVYKKKGTRSRKPGNDTVKDGPAPASPPGSMPEAGECPGPHTGDG